MNKKIVVFVDILLALTLIYLFALQLYAVWTFTIDDMYISLRYAKHWASGEGLLWNLNQPAVEGYSNFSFVALAALAIKMGLHPVAVLKWTGIAGLALTCWALTLISRFWFSWRIALIPSLWLLFYKGQIIWTVSGLETTVYQALLAFAVYFAYCALGYRFYPLPRSEKNLKDYCLAGLMLSLAGLTRPEAPVFMIMFFILFCLDRPKGYQKGLGVYTLSICFFYLPYFIWRLMYFGRLFPNSVYCKGIAADAWMSLNFDYLMLWAPFLLISLPALRHFKEVRYWFLALPSFIYLVLLAGADPVAAFYNRLFLPAFALYLPLSLIGIEQLLLLVRKERDLIHRVFMSLIAIIIALLYLPMMSLQNYRHFTKAPIEGAQLRETVVAWLNKNVASDNTVVLGDTGYVPYHGAHQYIDSYCLNNAAMTRSPRDNMYQQFCERIMEKKPDVIILTSLVKPDKVIYAPADACLRKKLEDYSVTKTFRTGKSGEETYYRYELYQF